MNICIINGDMSRCGGTEKMTATLANLLFNRGYVVHIVSLAHCESTYYDVVEGVHFHSLGNRHKGMLSTYIKLYSCLKAIKADIIVNVDVFLCIYTIPLSWLIPKSKVVAWEMFSIRNDMGISWSRLLRSFCLKFCDFYVCLTKGDLLAFQKDYRVKCAIDYIYNPVDNEHLEYDYNQNSKVIISAGNFFYAKGFDMAIEVAKKVLPNHPNWKWQIYGDGPEKTPLKELIIKYNLCKQVEIKERTRTLYDKLANSALYVLTSRTEGFGLVLIEAKCCNLPIVSFDVPYGPNEIIEDNVNGFLISPFDIDDMAIKIDELINNVNLRIDFSSKAKNNIDKFSPKEFVTKWESVFNYLVK